MQIFLIADSHQDFFCNSLNFLSRSVNTCTWANRCILFFVPSLSCTCWMRNPRPPKVPPALWTLICLFRFVLNFCQMSEQVLEKGKKSVTFVNRCNFSLILNENTSTSITIHLQFDLSIFTQIKCYRFGFTSDPLEPHKGHSFVEQELMQWYNCMDFPHLYCSIFNIIFL